uniref:Uncharacterized protein n=1 Tax=Oryza rufipogon TaxID=4529 RepID=A0A0E0PL69_ORYRU
MWSERGGMPATVWEKVDDDRPGVVIEVNFDQWRGSGLCSGRSRGLARSRSCDKIRTKLSEELRSRTIRKSCDKVEIKVTHGGQTPCREVIATGFAKSTASVEIRKEIGIKTYFVCSV